MKKRLVVLSAIAVSLVCIAYAVDFKNEFHPNYTRHRWQFTTNEVQQALIEYLEKRGALIPAGETFTGGFEIPPSWGGEPGLKLVVNVYHTNGGTAFPLRREVRTNNQ